MSLVKYASDERVTPSPSGHGFYFQHSGTQYLIEESSFLGWTSYHGPELDMLTFGSRTADDTIDAIIEYV